MSPTFTVVWPDRRVVEGVFASAPAPTNPITYYYPRFLGYITSDRDVILNPHQPFPIDPRAPLAVTPTTPVSGETAYFEKYRPFYEEYGFWPRLTTDKRRRQ